MNSINIHEIILDKGTLQILSADAAFYAFMGERLYVPFEKFIPEEDQKTFYQKLSDCSGERFMVRLIGENGKKSFYFSRIEAGPSPSSVSVFLLYAEALVEIRSQLKKSVSIKNALLELYHDTYFEYEPSNDTIRLYTLERCEQNIGSYPLEKFECRLMLHADEEQKKTIHEFITSLRIGARRFEMYANRNLFEENDEDCLMTIRAASLYEKGIFFIATGCIHIGSAMEQEIHRKIEVDSLTGLMTKADITSAAIDLINIRKVRGITLAIIDIDYFKKVNDTYGHMCGDEVLQKVAGIMEKEVGESGLIGRIGGDEFLIVFFHADNMEHMRERLKCIKNNVKASFPRNVEGQPAITLSMGCAAYPKDADQYETLFFLADHALYRAKEKGRDRYIIYDKAKHGDLETIRSIKKTGSRIDSRGNMSMGDVLCVMMNRIYGKEAYPLENLLDDFVLHFGIQRLMIHAGTPCHIVHIAGEHRPSPELISETGHYTNLDGYLRQFDASGILFLNNVRFLEDTLPDVYELLGKLSIHSLIQIKFKDINGTPAILSLESVKGTTTWNRSNLHYYRLFAKILSEYELL